MPQQNDMLVSELRVTRTTAAGGIRRILTTQRIRVVLRSGE
jgi:hypothetical protein